MAKLALVIEAGAGVGQSRAIAGAALRLGRSADADWRIGPDDAMVSRFHAVVRAEGRELVIEDTSSNGVFVNDEAVPLGNGGVRRLGPDDRVRIGDQVLRVTLEGGPTASHTDLPGDAGGWFDEAPAKPAAIPPAESGGWFDSEWLSERELAPAEHPLDPGRRRVSPAKAPVLEQRPMPRLVEPQGPEPSANPFDDPFAEPPAAVTVPPPAAAVEARKPVDDSAEERLVAAFLRGAGIDRRALGEVETEKLLEEAGARLRELAHGVTQLLQARAEFKNAARVARTQIQGTGNNPLKFALSPEEAVLAVLIARDRAYLPPESAVAAAVHDLQEHELRVLEAIQVALNSLLARFDPVNFEAEMEKESLLTTLVAGGRRGRCWELFRERFAAMSAEGRNRFLGEVGPAFAQAYEADPRAGAAKRRGGG